MALSSVYLASDAHFACLQHALSVKEQGILGLLIGEVDSEKVVRIAVPVFLGRYKRRKNGCKISPEDLTKATVRADKLTRELGKPMRVVGWYLSSPNTGNPPPIRMLNQDAYKIIDEGFVELLISFPSEDEDSTEQSILCCEVVSEQVRMTMPLHILPNSSLSKPCLQSIAEFPEILCQEEEDTYNCPGLSIIGQLKNEALHTQALCEISEDVYGPLITTLEQRKRANEERCKELRERKKKLLELKALNQ